MRTTVSAVLAGALALSSALPARAQGLSLIRDTEIETLLNDYARPIFRAAGLGNQPIRVRIVRQEGFNAFVVDGQNVFVNTGMLTQSKTPNQVIGVIAHETGHIAGAHLGGLRQRIAQDSTKCLLMQILMLGAAIGGAAASKEGSTSQPGALLGIGCDPVMRGLLQYRRQQEQAADRAAVSYLTATKQSGRGMLEVFEEFAKQEYLSAQNQDPYVRSHPMAADRIAQLRDLVESSPLFKQADPPALQLRHDLMRAKINGFLSERNPRNVFNTYPPTDTSLPARYARAIATFFAADVNAALPQVDALIRENPSNPYFVELRGEFLFRAGRAADAAASFRKALQIAGGNATLIRVQLAQAMLADPTTKNFAEVVDMLRKTAAVEGDNAELFQQLATAHYKAGNEAEANLATAQARFYSGNLNDAKSFAKRAQLALPKGSPGWIKADDIVNHKAQKQ
jgi:predicted Zn-dependent protease